LEEGGVYFLNFIQLRRLKYKTRPHSFPRWRS
jgi:hypothetical protein